MRCALELKVMNEEYERRKEKERLLKIYEQTKKNELEKEKTIEYAEQEISPKLEEYANGERWRHFNRINIDSRKWFEDYGVMQTDIIGQEHFILLKCDDIRYANGDKSYSMTNETINLNYLKEYLNQFCLKLEVEKYPTNYYGFKSYGHGTIEDVYKIIVEPDYSGIE